GPRIVAVFPVEAGSGNVKAVLIRRRGRGSLVNDRGRLGDVLVVALAVGRPVTAYPAIAVRRLGPITHNPAAALRHVAPAPAHPNEILTVRVPLPVARHPLYVFPLRFFGRRFFGDWLGRFLFHRFIWNWICLPGLRERFVNWAARIDFNTRLIRPVGT